MNVSTAETGTRRMGMAEALRDAMRIAMKSDPTVFLIGEDIGVPGRLRRRLHRDARPFRRVRSASA